MLIAVNTQLLIKDKLEGIGWFTYENLKRITQAHPEHKFLFIFDRPYDKEFIFNSNILPVQTKVPSRHPFLWYWHFERDIPRILDKYKPDIFLSPDGWMSLKTETKTVYVLHDLNFIHSPKDLPFWVRKYYNRYVPRYVKKAERIATVSEFTKQDIVNSFKANPDKIDVVYNGVNESYHHVDNDTKKFTRFKYSNGNPYFIYVGSINPRKNIANLLRAFDNFKKKTPNNANLVIVGAKMWGGYKELDHVYKHMKYQKDVLFTGRLSNEELNKVISSALAMVYVSKFEGFGIPILEAMKCQTPVITSNITSMPEVAGDAAFLIDPHSVNSITEAMLKIFMDENLRAELIKKGNERLINFSWQKTSEKLWQCIEKSIDF